MILYLLLYFCHSHPPVCHIFPTFLEDTLVPCSQFSLLPKLLLTSWEVLWMIQYSDLRDALISQSVIFISNTARTCQFRLGGTIPENFYSKISNIVFLSIPISNCPYSSIELSWFPHLPSVLLFVSSHDSLSSPPSFITLSTNPSHFDLQFQIFTP